MTAEAGSLYFYLQCTILYNFLLLWNKYKPTEVHNYVHLYNYLGMFTLLVTRQQAVISTEAEIQNPKGHIYSMHCNVF